VIHNHAITRAVAQAHIDDLIAQAAADGRAERASPAWWRLRRRRPAARTATAEAARPTRPTANPTRAGTVRIPSAPASGAESMRVGFERLDPASHDGVGVELNWSG
jgi:hypothetical protein